MQRHKDRDAWSPDESHAYRRHGVQPLTADLRERIATAVGEAAGRLGFADPEDALTAIESSITRGALDSVKVIDDDGRVDTSAIEAELGQLLERKPHYRSSLESLSPADHAARRFGADEQQHALEERAEADPGSLSVEEHAIRKYGAEAG